MNPLIFCLLILAAAAAAAPAEPPPIPDLMHPLSFVETMPGRIPGERPLLVEGRPVLSVLSWSLVLPAGYTAEATLEEVRTAPVAGIHARRLVGEPHLWGPRGALAFPRAEWGRYFPGKWMVARDVGGKLAVAIFPFRYDRTEKRLVALRTAILRVRYKARAADDGLGSLWNSPGIIVVPQAMLTGAILLQKYHWQHFGLSSEIVTVETIEATESPLPEEELPAGYKSREAADKIVVPYDRVTGRGYRYDLARRIAAYLRKRMGTDSVTRYVTLLGDADAIPPSYYFAVAQGAGLKFGVTDLCYGAREKCLDPRLAVGRLPFRSVDEVGTYLGKLSRWIEESGRSSSELGVFGGKAFPGEVLLGELGTLMVADDRAAGWRGVRKGFRSNGGYSKAGVLEMLSGRRESAFVYHLDHGRGNQLLVDGEFVDSRDLDALTESGPKVNPVLVSIACSNAAVDNGLLKESVFAPEEFGRDSVGMASLRSRGGAVAYVGASRPAVGSPVYTIDKNGNLNLTGTNYGLQLLDGVFEAYREKGQGRLGDVVLAALRAYRFERGNDFSNPRHQWTYFNFAFLGDPSVRLPVRRDKTSSAFPARSVGNFDEALPPQLPKFWFTQGSAGEYELALESAGPVVGTLLRFPLVGFDPIPEVVETRRLDEGSSPWKFRHNGSDEQIRYLLRLENAQGMPLERQVWFHVEGRQAPPAIRP